MLYKIKSGSFKDFTNKVFGADCFLQNFPAIIDEGVELERVKKYGIEAFYIMENGKPVNDTCFFSDEEMVYLEPIGL